MRDFSRHYPATLPKKVQYTYDSRHPSFLSIDMLKYMSASKIRKGNMHCKSYMQHSELRETYITPQGMQPDSTKQQGKLEEVASNPRVKGSEARGRKIQRGWNWCDLRFTN
jgi:hypothetical protein